MSFELRVYVENAFKACFPDADLLEDSDFFDLGGDSLKAVDLCRLIGGPLGMEVHPSILFSHSTPATLTDALRRECGSL